MAVLVIVGLIATISFPRYGAKTVIKFRVKGAAMRIMADLRLARRLAISDREEHILKIYPEQHSYMIFRESIATANKVGETRIIVNTLTITGDENFIFEPGGNISISSGTEAIISEDVYQANIEVAYASGKPELILTP